MGLSISPIASDTRTQKASAIPSLPIMSLATTIFASVMAAMIFDRLSARKVTINVMTADNGNTVTELT